MMMQKIATFLLVLALSVCALPTEAKQKADPTPKERAEKMAKQLNLTAQQESHIEALNAKYASVLGKKPDTMKKSSRTYAKRKQQRQEYRKEVKKFLTPAQAKQYDKIRAQKKAEEKAEKAAKKKAEAKKKAKGKSKSKAKQADDDDDDI
jgi:Spy/CpxP family protein refolding chaperone